MATRVENTAQLTSLERGAQILLAQKGPAKGTHGDNFLVHGDFQGVDGHWLDISDSVRVPIEPDMDIRDINPLVGILAKGGVDFRRESATISYNLTGFPGENYVIYKVE